MATISEPLTLERGDLFNVYYIVTHAIFLCSFKAYKLFEVVIAVRVKVKKVLVLFLKC